jgi:hypothetical protein
LALRAAFAQEGREGVVWGAFTFGTVHGVMQGLERTLKDLLGSFLAGDAQAISEQADAVVAEMSEVAEAFPERPENDRELWSALWDISKHARQMQSAAQRSEYQNAYRHFTQLTNRCIQCHQDRRVWGKFSVTAPADQAAGPAARQN